MNTVMIGQIQTATGFNFATSGGDTPSARVKDKAAVKTATAGIDTNGNLIVNDPAASGRNDNLTIKVTGTNYRISDPDNILQAGKGTTQVTNDVLVPMASVTGNIQVNSLAGDDNLTIDLSGGNFLNEIIYNGGLQTNGDAMTITGGGTFPSVTHSFVNENDGSIAITANSNITYIGLEPIIDNLAVTDRVFTFTGGAEIITLRNDVSAGFNFIDSTLGESVTFTNPFNSLTINSGSGDDTMIIRGLDAAFDANLTVNGYDAIDLVIFLTAETNVTSGDITINADRIHVAQNITTTGNITLTADKDVSIRNSAIVQSTDGDINITGGNNPQSGDVFDGVSVISNAEVKTTGTGNISITGTACSTATNSNAEGLFLDTAKILTTGVGSINLTGTGSNGNVGNSGLLLANSRAESNGGGITMTGIAGQGIGGVNEGIVLISSIIIDSNGGHITMNGTGNGTGNSSNSRGISFFTDSDVSTTTGTIIITGQGANNASMSPVGFLCVRSNLNSVDGNIIINGTGGSGTGRAGNGISAFGMNITTTGTGAISVLGVAGQSSTEAIGVLLDTSGRIQSNGGGITIRGTSNDTPGGSSSIGARIYANISDLQSGDINITGIGATGIDDGYGLRIAAAATIRAVNGNINIDGTAGQGTGVNNMGVRIYQDAIIEATGTGGTGTDNNHGILVDDANTAITSDSGLITLNGTSGSATGDFNQAVLFKDDVKITSTSGGVALTGTTATARYAAVDFDATNTGTNITTTGNISITTITGECNTPDGVLTSPTLIAASTTINGKVAPGTTVGQFLMTTNLALSSGDTLEIKINNFTTPGVDYDQLAVTGTVDITGATLTLVDNALGAIGGSNELVLIDNDGTDAVIGQFASTNVANFNSQSDLIIDYVGGDGNDVVLRVSNSTVSITNGNLVITDPETMGRNDNLTIVMDGSNYRISDPDNDVVAGTGTTQATNNDVLVPIASVTGNIQVTTLAGDDNLTVDLSGGNFTDEIIYNGGLQTNGDAMTITGGGTFPSVTHSFVNENDGSIAITGNSNITYIGLEPIIDNLSVTDRVFTFTGGAEEITLRNDVSAGSNFIDSTRAESVTFTNPINSLTINSGSGDDTINIQGLDAGFDANLTVNGDDAIDLVIFQTDETNVTSGDITINADSINVTQNITTTGNITLTADKDVSIRNSVIVQSTDGDINIIGGNNPQSGDVFDGVSVISNAEVKTTGTGNISITGTAFSTATNSFAEGLVLDTGKILTTGVGSINLTGTGSNGNVGNRGLFLVNSRAESNGGGITMTGIGGQGIGESNEGIILISSTIIDSNGGDITMNGTGNGTGNSSNSRGISVIIDSEVSTTTGTINITGQGANNASMNPSGFFCDSCNLNSIDGNIIINGTGGSGTGMIGYGIIARRMNITTTGTGAISVLGVAGQGTGVNNMGVRIHQASIIEATGTGAINITGTGGTGTDNNHGILVDDADTAITSNSGLITLNGTSGNATGDFNQAVLFKEDVKITSNSGGVALTGSTATASYAAVDFDATNTGTNITTTGNISITTITGEFNTPDGVLTSPTLIAASTTINGKVAPGTTVGQFLMTTNLAISSGNELEIEITDFNIAGVDYDQLAVTGTVDLTGVTLTLIDNTTETGARCEEVILIDNDGTDPVTGAFVGLDVDDDIMFNGELWRISYEAGDGNDVALAFNPGSIAAPVCQAFTVSLDSNGMASITVANVDNNTPRGCDFESLEIDKSSFTCDDLGANDVILTVKDIFGNTATCTAVVTVQDVTAPVPDATSLADVNVQCEVTTLVAPTATDNCAATVTVTNDATLPITTQGTTAVTWTYDDGNGNISTQTQNVIIDDVTPPVAVCLDITVELDSNGQATIVKEDIIPTPSYTVNQTGTFAPVLGTGTFITLDDEEVSSPLQVGFDFNFFGVDYGQFYISANGFITFTPPADAACCFGRPIPLPDTINNFIAFSWDDLNPMNGGTIDYFTTGTAPNRKLIVNFTDIQRLQGGFPVTVQTILYENSGLIEMHTTNMTTDGFENTQGIENLDGSLGVATPGRNAASWSATNDYVSFTPIDGITDNCGVASTVMDITSFDCTNLGTNIVTLTVTDVNGNVFTCQSTVTVEDNLVPVPDLVTLEDVTAECEVPVLVAPTATDNCSVTITNDATLPITAQATTVVTWTYDDGNGNISTQTQNVIIDDVTAPIPDVVALADVTAECEVTSLVAPTGTDNCAATVTVTSDVILPITIQGTTLVTWRYDDGNGNTATQTQNVVINDITPPAANTLVLADITAECEVTSLVAPTATDNCSNATVTVTNDATLPITIQATTVVTWTYDDGNGNISTQTQNVVIDDVTLPVADAVSLPDMVFNCEVTALTAPTATDNCVGVVTGTATFPITATRVVSWSFDDGNGNVSTQDQTIIIEQRSIDAIPTAVACDSFTLPAITGDFLTGNQMYYTEAGGAGLAFAEANTINFSDFATYPVTLYAYDVDAATGCSAEISFQVTLTQTPVITPSNDVTVCDEYVLPALSVGNYYTFPAGNGTLLAAGTRINATQTLFVYAEDVSGNCTDEDSFVVTITPLDDASFNYDMTTYCPNGMDPAPNITGRAGGNFTATIGLVIDSATGVVDLGASALGSYVITYTTTGSCPQSATATITIEDTTAPLPDVAVLEEVTAQCEVTSLTAPTATDGCSGAVSVTSDATLPITGEGTTTVVTSRYDDGNGNITTQTQNIVIDDVTAPVANVTTLTDLIFNCEVGSLTAPTATDNCAGTIVGTTTAVFPITSTTTLTWTYDDGNGNQSTQDLTVIIESKSIDAIANAVQCDSFTLPAITGDFLTGTQMYHTETGGNGLVFAEADILNFADFASYPVTLYAYDVDAIGCSAEISFQVTLTETPSIGTIADVTLCDEYTLPALAVGNYYTFPGGTGTLLNAGTVLTDTQTLFVYAQDVSGACTDQESFVVTITDTDIAGATLANESFTYDGTTQSLTVGNIPASATVVYTNNDQVNAGTYQVTATITSATASCNTVELTATMTIDRAPQTISFDALSRRWLNVDPDFQLTASSSSGLAVVYDFTFTGASPAATVSTTGFVSLLEEGEILILASQAGSANYLPATTVRQTLEVYLENDTSLNAIVIDGNRFTNPGDETYYLIECNDDRDSVDVVIENATRATFDLGATFTIATPAPGIYTQLLVVTADNGRDTQVYTIVVERRFDFDAIVEQKFNNTLIVNNNFNNNGGYEFVAYEWFKNGRRVSTEQSFSEGDNASDLLDPTAAYYVKMTTVQGDVLQTCISTVELGAAFSLSVLENPVRFGRHLNLRADFPLSELEGATYQIYTAAGRLIKTVPVQGFDSSVALSSSLPVGLYRVVLVTSQRTASVNFIKN